MGEGACTESMPPPSTPRLKRRRVVLRTQALHPPLSTASEPARHSFSHSPKRCHRLPFTPANRAAQQKHFASTSPPHTEDNRNVPPPFLGTYTPRTFQNPLLSCPPPCFPLLTCLNWLNSVASLLFLRRLSKKRSSPPSIAWRVSALTPLSCSPTETRSSQRRLIPFSSTATCPLSSR